MAELPSIRREPRFQIGNWVKLVSGDFIGKAQPVAPPVEAADIADLFCLVEERAHVLAYFDPEGEPVEQAFYGPRVQVEGGLPELLEAWYPVFSTEVVEWLQDAVDRPWDVLAAWLAREALRRGAKTLALGGEVVGGRPTRLIFALGDTSKIPTTKESAIFVGIENARLEQIELRSKVVYFVPPTLLNTNQSMEDWSEESVGLVPPAVVALVGRPPYPVIQGAGRIRYLVEQGMELVPILIAR